MNSAAVTKRAAADEAVGVVRGDTADAPIGQWARI